MAEPLDLLTWLREQCADYRFNVGGVFQRDSDVSSWPLEAAGPCGAGGAAHSRGSPAAVAQGTVGRHDDTLDRGSWYTVEAFSRSWVITAPL